MLLLEVLQVLIRSRDRGTAALLRPKYVRLLTNLFIALLATAQQECMCRCDYIKLNL